MGFPVGASIGARHIVGNISYEWNGYAWDAVATAGAVAVTKYEHTATSGQTVFAAAGYRSKKYVDVYINGMKLSDTDFAASDETTVVLNVGATVGDLVAIEVSDAVIMADIIKTVNVTTLASGASATVGYADGGLTFGIPAGAQGVTGTQGIQGPKGDTGDAGEVTLAQLTTAIDGIDALPAQTGNAGKYLTTDGTDASWSEINQINDATTTLTDTWSSSKISGELNKKVASTNLTELTQDIIGSSVVGGSNITATYNDTTGQTEIDFSGSIAGGFTNMQVFNTSGTFNIASAKGAGVYYVECVGGGGGGGGGVSRCGQGGGGAGAVVGFATISANVTVTIGSGGSGGSGTATGSSGGTSSFGSFCTANGGDGGSGSSAGHSFNGGSGTIGSNFTGKIKSGNAGGNGSYTEGVVFSLGGSSAIGGGAASVSGSVDGAGGNCFYASGGGSGGSGYVIVMW